MFVNKRSVRLSTGSAISPTLKRASHPSLVKTIFALALTVVAAGCGSSDSIAEPSLIPSETATSEAGDPAEPTPETLFPDVLAAEATTTDGTTFDFSATLSSAYDSPERYADAWRILGPDGTEYGIRVLTHDHANEQPFTRSLSSVEIPIDVTVVTVEGRDQVSGWGGDTVEVALPSR